MDEQIKSMDFEKHFKTGNILIHVVKFVIVLSPNLNYPISYYYISLN